MKKIIIDVYSLKHQYVGVGEFCRHIGLGMAKRAMELRSKYDIELYFIVPSKKFIGCFGNEVHYLHLPAILSLLPIRYPFQADLFHLPHQYTKFADNICANKKLLTIHDINFVYEKKGGKLRKYTNLFTKRISKTDYINYISNFARHDAESHFKIEKPSRVIYNGATDLSDCFDDKVSNSLKQKLPTSYFLHISSLLPKKNVHLLVEMMKYLPNEKLVIVGNWNSTYGKKLKEIIANFSLSNIIQIDNVTESEKAYLYKNCRAFLFPSVCEGFGLPPIEAMKFGKPVFLSTSTSLPEVGGEAAFYWDDFGPQNMAEKVKESLNIFYSNVSFYREQMKNNASRFTWPDCINQYIQYYLCILGLS